VLVVDAHDGDAGRTSCTRHAAGTIVIDADGPAATSRTGTDTISSSHERAPARCSTGAVGREGRGRLLVVEEDFRAERAREVDGRLVWTDDPSADVLDDPVDEIVEHVVRAGGNVEFVSPDALAELGRIGSILR
jgi:hypothetical protein